MTDKATDTPPQTPAVGGPRFSEGLGPLYAQRDHVAQGDYYTRHVSAMTGEKLHAKSAIAAELAHRDIEIETLRKAAEMMVLVAVHHTVAACKGASGQHRVIDHFVNKTQIVNEVLKAWRESSQEARA